MVEIQTNKDRYRNLCVERQDIPLFNQSWWMDAVCNNKNWDILIFERSNKILGVLVYYYIKKLGYKIIIQPQLTQFNGIWLDYSNRKIGTNFISFEKEVMTDLIKQLEELKFCYYDQNFHYSFTNWLPYYWKGYEQTTRYTYQILDISDIEKCYSQFKGSKKSHINKAKKNIKINFDLSGEEFYSHLKQNLKVIGHKVNYTKDLFMRIYDASKLRNQGCIISAYDTEMNLHAALFLVWDNYSAYNLISTINPEYRSSGATSLLFYEAINQMSTKSKIFDFEGSMSENIEKSFSEFGSVQIPYFRIRKFNSICFKILYHSRKWLKS